jgi:hypothetical protein
MILQGAVQNQKPLPGHGQWIPQKQSAVPAVRGVNKAGWVMKDEKLKLD